jgi:hypothetical protein
MLVFNKYFYKNKKSKLYFGDRVTVLNDFIYQTGGSTCMALLRVNGASMHANAVCRRLFFSLFCLASRQAGIGSWTRHQTARRL